MDVSTILSVGFTVVAVAIPVLLLVAAYFILGRIFYKVPGPDDALVITGRGAGMTKDVREQLAAEREAAASSAKDPDAKTQVALTAAEPDPEFKVVVGTGSWLKPGQRMERLSLRAQEADVELVKVPTVQGINLDVAATVIYKVGDSYSAIVRAARRFAGNNDWTKMVSNVLEGHLRAVVGTMTVEDIWRNRDALAQSVSEASGEDLVRLGLQIESFQLKPIGDPSGYIDNLAAQTHAEAKRNAEITRAENEQLSATRVAETATLTAQAVAESAIAQAKARQESERVEAEANQAKPLAEAKAQQAVILEKTKNAELEKDLNKQTLEATVYQQADAQKYAQVVNAQAQSETAVIQAEAQAQATQVAADARRAAAESNAEADAVATERAARAEAVRIEAAATAEANATTLRAAATQKQGEAEAAAEEARGLATAKVTLEQGTAIATAKRLEAEAVSQNQEAVVALELVKQLPNVMAANASAYGRVGQITVMGGMEDVQEGLNGILQQGLAALPAILGSIKGAGISQALGAIPTFATPSITPSEDTPIKVGALAADQKGLAALADKVGGKLSEDIQKAAKKVKASDTGLADVSDAFEDKAIDIDTTLPTSGGRFPVGDLDGALDSVSGGIEQAQGYVDQAGEVAGQAQEFLHANQDTVDQLAAVGSKIRRRTR